MRIKINNQLLFERNLWRLVFYILAIMLLASLAVCIFPSLHKFIPIVRLFETTKSFYFFIGVDIFILPIYFWKLSYFKKEFSLNSPIVALHFTENDIIIERLNKFYNELLSYENLCLVIRCNLESQTRRDHGRRHNALDVVFFAGKKYTERVIVQSVTLTFTTPENSFSVTHKGNQNFAFKILKHAHRIKNVTCTTSLPETERQGKASTLLIKQMESLKKGEQVNYFQPQDTFLNIFLACFFFVLSIVLFITAPKITQEMLLREDPALFIWSIKLLPLLFFVISFILFNNFLTKKEEN